ncbi:MAG: hypothetical protein ACLVJQ_09150 [Lentihominibacter sp.]
MNCIQCTEPVFDMAIIIYLAYQFFMPDKSNEILPIMVWIIVLCPIF